MFINILIPKKSTENISDAVTNIVRKDKNVARKLT